jgi:Protein of unknown function (DUF3800)
VYRRLTFARPRSLPLKHYTAYIDEAGDEGFGKLAAGGSEGQSRWLCVGACIVTRENDLKLPGWRNDILAKFPKKKTRDLHFRELKHEQKIVVCQDISKLPIGVCVTLSHKITIPGSKWEATFKKKGYLYNWLLRWLLERVTTVCLRDGGFGSSIKIVFSRRANTDYQTMRDYFLLMKGEQEKMPQVRRIDFRLLDIDNMAVENHSKWAGLQIADCVTSAFFLALEPNAYGNYEQTYAKLLKDRLIKDRTGHYLNCGITPVPSWGQCRADPQQLEFFEWFVKR